MSRHTEKKKTLDLLNSIMDIGLHIVFALAAIKIIVLNQQNSFPFNQHKYFVLKLHYLNVIQ